VADPGTPLLAVRELSIDFITDAGPRAAVNGISLTMSPGQVLALAGESGSGKSVTALSLLGLLPGTARVRGSAVLGGTGGTELVGADSATLRSVRGGRIGAVFQDPFTTFNPVMRIGAQIAEALGAHAKTDAREAAGRVLTLLERAGLRDTRRIARSFPHELSGGQLQRAMIAMAISGEPDLLIADEPTTALDVTVQAGILDLLHSLRADTGTAILLITHDMGVAADLADDVVVMRHGQIMEAGTARDVFFSPRSAYTRELLDAVPRVDVASAEAVVPKETVPAEPVAELRDVTITYGSGRHRLVAVNGVSLSVPAGETVGLVGESGSGKTTLGKAIARLVPAASGSITVAGRDLHALRRGSLRAAQAEIGFVFQNPSDSLNPRARVGDIVAEPLRIHTSLRRAERERRAAELLGRVDLPEDAASRFPHELSGGQRQRVAIARALVLGPKLVIADEPTSSLDVLVQATILKLLAALQDEFGFGCLFISHDLAVVRQVSRQVAVMREGRVVESGPTDQVLSRPEHEYTRTLLASIPLPDPVAQRATRA
jgi:peptide/nickel transport system ATP-binding protein